jgi:hypothetical protein
MEAIMNSPAEPAVRVTSSDGEFEFRLPRESEQLAQDEEWVSVRTPAGWRSLRIHDYEAIYERPGLYEALVYDVLECHSPQRLVHLLHLVLDNESMLPRQLRALDLGAGNGIVAEELRRLGVPSIVGLDILPEAAVAAKRDRPGLYEDYIVADLTEPDADCLQRLRRTHPNMLITVAALGFDDIPPGAFRTAFNAIDTPGWIALTIKEAFLQPSDDTGFRKLLRLMLSEGIVLEEARLRIRHRISILGEPLYYLGIIARKQRDIPQDLAI